MLINQVHNWVLIRSLMVRFVLYQSWFLFLLLLLVSLVLCNIFMNSLYFSDYNDTDTLFVFSRSRMHPFSIGLYIHSVVTCFHRNYFHKIISKLTASIVAHLEVCLCCWYWLYCVGWPKTAKSGTIERSLRNCPNCTVRGSFVPISIYLFVYI